MRSNPYCISSPYNPCLQLRVRVTAILKKTSETIICYFKEGDEDKDPAIILIYASFMSPVRVRFFLGNISEVQL